MKKQINNLLLLMIGLLTIFIIGGCGTVSKSSGENITNGNINNVITDSIFDELWQTNLINTGEIYPQNYKEDENGNILIFGEINGFLGGTQYDTTWGDGFVAKLRSDGTIIYQKNIGGLSSDDIEDVVGLGDGRAIVVGSSDSDCFTVVSGNSIGTGAIAVGIAFNGDILWQKKYAGSSIESIIKISENEFICIGTDYQKTILLTIDSNGNILKEKIIDEGDDFSSVFIKNSRVFITYSNTVNNVYTTDFIEIDLDGSVLNRFSEPKSNLERICDIDISNNGDIYLTGYWRDSTPYRNSVTLAIDSNFNKKWLKKINTSKQDYFYNAVYSQTGNCVYVAGNVLSPEVEGYHGSIDGFLAKYSSAGDLLWKKCLGYDHLDTSEDIDKLYIGNDGYLYVFINWLDYNKVLKMDANGNTLDEISYGARTNIYSISQNQSGGFTGIGVTWDEENLSVIKLK